MGSFALKTISIAVVIALIVGAGAGYMVGNSPVSNLMEERDQLVAMSDSLYLAFQDLEAELNSTQELLVEGQRNWELFRERYLEMLEENQEFTQQVINLESEIMVLESLTSDMQSELDELEQIIKDHEATASASAHILSVSDTDVLRLQWEVERLQALLPDLSSASYRGSLETWYHYVDISTEEIIPQYDAKFVDGSWSLVDLGDGVFRLRMRWTELNLDESVEGAPRGTHDKFLVTLLSEDINVSPTMIMLYGDAYWQKIHWDGKIGEWTSSGVEIHISPILYDHEFVYYHSGYVAGFGLLIYGSLYPS